MTDPSEESPPRRSLGKLWLLLLLPLPGLIYPLLFNQIIHSHQETLAALSQQVGEKYTRQIIVLNLQSAAWSFAFVLPVLVFAAVKLTKASRLEKPPSFRETILTCFSLTVVNIFIAGAGCSFRGGQ